MQMQRCSISFSAILSDNFFVILDTVQGGLYQIDQETKTPYTIEIDDANVPTTLTYDPVRKDVIWVDIAKHAVKKKRLGSTEEIAVRSGVDDTSTVTVDVSTGNIYISSGGEIIIVSPSLDVTTVVDSTDINGDIGKIALMPESGLMSWFESGDTSRIMIGNMDGTNIRPISVTIDTPEDIAFDLEDGIHILIS
ncbi:low-density lipoprotein receptor-related protein 5-like [Mercenaria mercenaria]|uniref:low-density lipoprotein receptor-related protein 5-like n=1 Tax=Mercenaria mercenaria TaxID=6596 RepID=UPI00234F1184|nr:low-density lipoprotein receptor-related protein 5-like [Mercenaria mercenaria]